jgi:citrate lyase beta subunit
VSSDSGDGLSVRRMRYRRIRSIVETPILDDRKWAKIPDIAADAFMLDLEDSVAPTRKIEARERVLSYLNEPEFFGDRLVIARPNNLNTPWGYDDVVALAQANVTHMAYPKASSAEEIDEVLDILAENGATPVLFPVVETAGAVFDAAIIAKNPSVGGLFTGIGDLSVDANLSFYDGKGNISGALTYARTIVVLASAAHGRSSTDTLFVKNIRDETEIRATIDVARRAGFTSLVTFYPPHVALINELLRASASEIDEALQLVGRYEEALALGNPAVLLPNGQSILALDYERAVRLLAIAGMDRSGSSLGTQV